MLRIRQVNEQQINAALNDIDKSIGSMQTEAASVKKSVAEENKNTQKVIEGLSKRLDNKLSDLDSAIGNNIEYINNHFVPNTRTVNGKSLSNNIELTASDVGAATVNDITNAINGLDASSVGGDGKYIKTISETNGIISATEETMDTTPTANSTKAVTSGGIKSAIDTAESNAKNLANATGTLPVANGGTGQTTQVNVNKAIIGAMDTGSSDVTDGTEFVSSYASDNGFSDTNAPNVPYKRTFLKVWNYIKGKISSVLGLTASAYGGKAATAGSADTAGTVDGYHADVTSQSNLIRVTRGVDAGSTGAGYWCGMSNFNIDGSAKWWHILSMDWSGSTANPTDWVSQLALPNRQGGVPYYRRNNASGTAIGSSTWHKFITDENIGSQSVNYATSAGSSGSCTGNSATATKTLKLVPALDSNTGASFDTYCLRYGQTSSTFDGNTGWAHYLIMNHGDGSTYYHYNVAFPFWDVPKYKRQTGSTSNVTPWYNFVTEENVDSSVRGCAVCTTAGGTAAKVASMRGFALPNPITTTLCFPITFTETNAAASELTLNINGTGAKKIYINGAVSSSSNYVIPAGTYLCEFYNDVYYIEKTWCVHEARDCYTLNGISGMKWLFGLSTSEYRYDSVRGNQQDSSTATWAGWRTFYSGLKIAWGHYRTSDSNPVTLPVTYTSKETYSVAVTFVLDSNGKPNYEEFLKPYSTTQIKHTGGNYEQYWITIGY